MFSWCLNILDTRMTNRSRAEKLWEQYSHDCHLAMLLGLHSAASVQRDGSWPSPWLRWMELLRRVEYSELRGVDQDPSYCIFTPYAEVYRFRVPILSGKYRPPEIKIAPCWRWGSPKSLRVFEYANKIDIFKIFLKHRILKFLAGW